MGVFEDSIGVFLHPIKDFLSDESVSEILINGPKEIYIEKSGRLERVQNQFHDEQSLQAAVRNIAQFVGRKIDENSPILEARLPDGSRIQAVFPPCARSGTTVSIRKFSKNTVTFIDLIKHGAISKPAARFLDICVYLGKNIIISGGTGSGKTTFLNVLGSRIPKNQRLLVIEDSSELQVETEHCIYFEARHPNENGEGEVLIRDLIRSALRLRPDRIVLGEVRGAESLDLVTAMNTGHGGSMGTIHANSPYDALVRLETLSMMENTSIPIHAIRQQIASAIHLVVQLSRMDDGSRKIVSIAEVLCDMDEKDHYQVREIFKFVQKGIAKDKKVVGEMVPTGEIPSFIDEIEVNRLPFDLSNFEAPEWAKKVFKHSKSRAA